jgi:hypothetical protein
VPHEIAADYMPGRIKPVEARSEQQVRRGERARRKQDRARPVRSPSARPPVNGFDAGHPTMLSLNPGYYSVGLEMEPALE